MKKRLMYIEEYTGANHNGNAWIAYVRQSKTGQTIYFQGKALKKFERGMYSDLESSDDYWITGVKKNGSNRHWAGSGKIKIDSTAVEEFKRLKDLQEIVGSRYEIVDIVETTDDDIVRLSKIENTEA
jgi:hypothetical protein